MSRTHPRQARTSKSATAPAAAGDSRDLFEAVAQLARSALGAEAVTLAFSAGATERLLVATAEGVRGAHGCVSLSVLKPGANRLAGGAGVLQSVEVASLVGFQPTGYLGSPFDAAQGAEGGLAAWDDGNRKWTAKELHLLSGLADLCVAHAASLHDALAAAAPAAAPSERYRRLFEQFSDPIFITDLDGNFIEANPAAFDYFGLDGGLAGYRVRDFYRDESEFTAVAQQLTDGARRVEMEVNLRHATGRALIGLLSALPLFDEDGRVVGQQAVVHDVTERRALEERLRAAALHDPLTQLPNRALFVDRLEQTLERSRRNNTSRYAVLFLDLNGFKAINDTFGHAAGDALLQAVARRLEGSLRAIDTVARMGGDEFAILLEDVPNQATAGRLVERLVKELHQPYGLDGRNVDIRPSIGLAIGSDRYHSAEEVINDADAAMYLSRIGDPAAYRVFDEEARRDWADRLAGTPGR